MGIRALEGRFQREESRSVWVREERNTENTQRLVFLAWPGLILSPWEDVLELRADKHQLPVSEGEVGKPAELTFL